MKFSASKQLAKLYNSWASKKKTVTNLLKQYQITGPLNDPKTKQEIINKTPEMKVSDLILISEFVRDIKEHIAKQLNDTDYAPLFDADLDGQILSFKNCQDYFGQNGLFGQVKHFIFAKIRMEEACFGEIPIATEYLSFNQVELIHSQAQAKGWGGALETIGKRLPGVGYLNIENAKLGEPEIKTLVDNMKSLEQLSLVQSEITPEGAEMIAGQLTHLTYLDLSGNQIGDTGVEKIVNQVQNNKLQRLAELILSGNNISSQGATEIATNFSNLTVLGLADNKIGLDGVEKVAQKLHNLRVLDLNNSGIDSAGALAIANTRSTALSELYLSKNGIDKDTAIALVENLPGLKILALVGNSISSDDEIEIKGKSPHLTIEFCE